MTKVPIPLLPKHTGSSENVVLFDMDGTLTPPRRRVDDKIIEAITDLREKATVGIVTGSGFKYLKEQCSHLIVVGNMSLRPLFFMPCNGTQLFEFFSGEGLSSSGYFQLADRSMITFMGRAHFNVLLQHLGQMQADALKEHFELPFAGHFIDVRRGMVNWCPIGREAMTTARNEFILFDREHRFRERSIKYLEMLCASDKLWSGLTFKLGGETSIDIFPSGWDKRLALTHFDKEASIWFVGDRTTGSGNDREIYEKIKPTGRAFTTTGPEDTVRIIRDEILPRL